jgi:hypothetical protein
MDFVADKKVIDENSDVFYRATSEDKTDLVKRKEQ